MKCHYSEDVKCFYDEYKDGVILESLWYPSALDGSDKYIWWCHRYHKECDMLTKECNL